MPKENVTEAGTAAEMALATKEIVRVLRDIGDQLGRCGEAAVDGRITDPVVLATLGRAYETLAHGVSELGATVLEISQIAGVA